MHSETPYWPPWQELTTALRALKGYFGSSLNKSRQGSSHRSAFIQYYPFKTTPSKGYGKAISQARAQDSIGIRVRPFILASSTGCPYSCHIRRRPATPGILDSIFGRLFVRYSGLPTLSPECDGDERMGAPSKRVDIEYWFPLSIWSTIVRIQLMSSLNSGPSLGLDI